MDEPGDDVFPGAALAGDKDRDVGGGYFAQPRTNRLHDLRVAKNYVVRRDLAQRLRQRTYRKCRHKTECPCGQFHPHALKVHPKRQTGEENSRAWKLSVKSSTYECLRVMIARKRQDAAWHQSAILGETGEGKNSSHGRNCFPQMLTGNSRCIGA